MKFEDLECGDIFDLKNELYMKIDPVIDRLGDNMVALDLKNGWLCSDMQLGFGDDVELLGKYKFVKNEHQEFLNKIYSILDAPRVMDLVLDYIDQLFCDGKFSECDELMQQVDLSRFASNVRRTFLTAIRPARDKLKCYNKVYTECVSLLVKETSQEEANKRLNVFK